MMNGQIDALVTAPINKSNIQNDEFNSKDIPNALQAFLIPIYTDVNGSSKFRVALVTNHLPLEAVSTSLTKELICKKAKLLNQTLKKDFGIIKPKIAVLALNPHSGDNGLIGNEEVISFIPQLKNLINKVYWYRSFNRRFC